MNRFALFAKDGGRVASIQDNDTLTEEQKAAYEIAAVGDDVQVGWWRHADGSFHPQREESGE